MKIPIFTTQLEKSREATDLANIRSAYAEAMVAALDSADGTGSATSVPMTQTGTGWQHANDSTIDKYTTATTVPDGYTALPAVLKTATPNTVTVSVAADGTVTIAQTTTTP